MGYWKQKLMEDQHQEMLEQMVEDYLSLFIFDVSSLSYDVYEESGFIVINFDEASANDLKTTFTLDEGKKIKLTFDELDSDFGYYDNEEFEAIVSQTETFIKLSTSIANIKKLIEVSIGDAELQKLLNNQCYISAIGTLETFLSEKLIGKIFSNQEYRKNFVLYHPAFSEMKFELREIFDKNENLDNIIKKLLMDQIYHNLPVVANMYNSSLNIKFPAIGEMIKAITIRHDLVHRNGKTKEGEVIEINKKDVCKLCDSINDFAKEIEDEIETE